MSHQGTLFTPPALPRYIGTTDLIRSAELGGDAAKTLGDRNAVFLVNHGVVTVGPDVRTATVTALLLEEACAQQLRTVSFGGTATWSDDAEAIQKRGRIYSAKALQRVWEYLLRKLEP